jgi:hypothetical protein
MAAICRGVTEGTIAGQPYCRQGLLGYDNMDQRYEWVTVDMNTVMTIYCGATIPPLLDAAQWNAFSAARRATPPNFRREHAAARYRSA